MFALTLFKSLLPVWKTQAENSIGKLISGTEFSKRGLPNFGHGKIFSYEVISKSKLEVLPYIC